jgi:hypothetical protein
MELPQVHMDLPISSKFLYASRGVIFSLQSVPVNLLSHGGFMPGQEGPFHILLLLKLQTELTPLRSARNPRGEIRPQVGKKVGKNVTPKNKGLENSLQLLDFKW